MSPKEPTLSKPLFSLSEKRTWPVLLDKLSLEDGLDLLYDWFDWEEYLDPELLDLLVERMGPDLDGLDYDDLARELLYIFEEEYQDDEALDEE